MAIALVQKNSNLDSTVNVGTCAFLSNNTAGNLLILVLRHAQQGVTVTITDSQGNTWAEATDLQGSSTGLWLFYAKNCAGGANTVTITAGGAAATMREFIAEYSGCDPVAPLDATSTATANSGLVSVPLTTGVDNPLLIVGHSTAVVSVASSGTGYTLEDTNQDRGGWSDNIGGLAGSETGLVNLATATTWLGVMASFAPFSPGVASVVVPQVAHRLYEFQYEC